MIVVDTSVWIDHFSGIETPAANRLNASLGKKTILLGDVIVLEVLQGTSNDAEARRLENLMMEFDVASMLSLPLAVRAAENYRKLRSAGATVRSTVDLIVGTFCIENRHELLHSDRDFDAMRDHLGLKTL